MIVRTAKGTATKTVTSTSLSLSNVQLDQGAACVVGLAWRSQQARAATVTWGARTLKQRGSIRGGNITSQIHVIRDVKALDGDTRDISVSWDGNTSDAALFVSQFTGVGKIDETSQKTENNVTNPDSGDTSATHYSPELAVACFASGGSLSDATGTPDTEFLLGQRDGSDSGSNDIVIVETYKELNATGVVNAGLTGAGLARWSTCLVTLQEVVKDDARIVLPASWYDKLIADQVVDGVNAFLLLTHARFYNEAIPLIPSDDTLTELGMTLTEYQDARTRLSTEGIVFFHPDGTIGSS